MKKVLYYSLLVTGTILNPYVAQAGDVSATATIDVVSDYVFRGVSLAETAVQPGVEVAVGDFYAGGWFSTGFGDTSVFAADELDLYAGYGIGLSDTLSADVGVTYYHYPQGGSLFSTNDGASGSYEVFGGLALDTVLSPNVYGYYDFTLETFTIIGDVSHSVPLGEKLSLDLGLTAGLVDGQDGAGYEYGQASASLGYAITDDVSTYVGAYYAINSEDLLDFGEAIESGVPDDNLFFFGAGVSAGF